ncbi:suppressor of fused homolog [Toxorhynchites rutilus septentrionalis]|uniref:suppressor of fused homolog n=1 Tax=Toxorhynchites rutilus septentrionalis TaxID=329112 RepID=UPI00247B285B|nr:suppressor of fused homolog [Toxorhynchites rutilus septentrionalis]
MSSIRNDEDDLLKRRMVPRGLQKLIEQCLKIYPDQTNPLQVTTVLKYWLGGQDPLDYISMYNNPGDPDQNIPPHWHYISFGLSDLHGDGRVHLPDTIGGMEPRSGMGFELTFRLVKSAENAEERPPTWPANLLQALAKYVFQSGNRLCFGDNIPWRRPLDGKSSSIQHMLIAEDPQMSRTETPFGWVDFLQIVGVTNEELEQASRWNGKGLLNLLQNDVITGGSWLITDMTRSKSVFELFPETLRQLECDLEREGSDLAGVNADFTFKELPKMVTVKKEVFDTEDEISKSISSCNIEIKKEFNDGLEHSGSSDMVNPFHHSQIPSRVSPLNGIELTLAPYAAKFLILAIKDRIRHGRHFTFKAQNMAVTFVAESVTGAIVNKDAPYGVLGYWVQILIRNSLIPKMLDALIDLNKSSDNLKIPLVYEWPEYNLKFIIDNPPPELLNQQGPILA